MKRTVRRQTISVALFPFLAVLICTMGSLIVLLVVFVHQATVDAQSIAGKLGGIDPAEAQRQQEALEDAQWRRELLEQQRAEKTAELAESRAKLAHLEEHIQRLELRAQELLARAEDIDEGKKLRDGELAAARDELGRLEAEIARKKSELDEARKRQQGRDQWYALIPYDGPNGTRRRPIYIECTQEGIIIQPEGIVFRAEDFRGPLGPGNPLDAALRTIREYLNQAGGKLGDPYPLIVVRPSGVLAYDAARTALKNWDDEFGYELISDDKKLAYGESDPALVAQLQRSVAVARQRQAALVAMTPRRFHDEEELVSFDPASHPGIQPEAFAGGGGPGRGVGNGAGAAGSGFSGAGTVGAASSGLGGNGTQPGGQFPGGAAGPYAGSPGQAVGGGQFGSAPGTSGASSSGSAQGQAGSGGAGGTAASGATGNPGGAAGSVGGAPGGTAGMGGSFAGGQSQPGNMQLPGGVFGNRTTSQGNASGGTSGTQDSQAGSSGAANQLGASGSQSSGSYTASQSGGSQSKNTAAKAGKSRGTNWGLPGAKQHATGITRPIRVAVLTDRIVLVPERGTDRTPQQVLVSPQLQAAEVDALVASVQKEMKSWGLAVAGGYWKPVLQMEVAAGAEPKFAELQTALQGSGFEIVRKR